MLGAEVKALVEPPGMKAYQAAWGDFYSGRRYLNMLASARADAHCQGAMHPDIVCLRSVSPGYKIHMMVERALAKQEEQRSFGERLLDLFGVREYLERERRYGGPDALEDGEGIWS